MSTLKEETKVKLNGSTVEMAQEGICKVCVHESDCTYKKSITRPVLQCEEFECFENGSGKNVAGMISFSPKLHNSKDEVDSGTGKYKGLCENCDDREVCVYPKPEGGVWHCEEYK